MEAVRKSQPQIAAPPAQDSPPQPKLTIEKFADGGIVCLKFNGTIDESFEGKKLARSIEGSTLLLDLGGVKKISSFGIREWVDFVGTAVQEVKQVVLIECAPKVVDQLNMVANFTGGGRLFSFYAPFRCDYCDSEQRVLLDVSKDFETFKTMKLADRPCPTCKENMYFDDDGATYFSYVLGQGAFALDADVVAFLAAKLDYRIGTIDQKLHVDKLIEGRLTYLRLSGDLNNTFPRDKLAEGLEGTVVVDVTHVPRVEPAGAAEWRAFISAVTPLVEQLYIVGAPPPFLEKLCGKDDLGAKGVVLDLTLPYACNACATSSLQSIDVAEHYDVLKFATAPELRCPKCGTSAAAMQCVASEGAMTILSTLPKPPPTKELARHVGMLKAREIMRRPSTGVIQLPKLAARRSSALPIVLSLILAVILAFGVVMFINGRGTRPTGPYGHGPVAARSSVTRPDWIKQGANPGVAYCSDEAGGLACVGVSTLMASQEDAEDEASDAAIESIAFELGKRITDPRWLAAVPPVYTPARDTKLAAMNRDPQSTQARREVREGRHAVAFAMRGLGPTAAGRYWEAFDGRDGRRFIAFAQVKLSPAEAQHMAGAYAKSETAFGATAVAFFPELAWKYGKLTHGAVITAIEPGLIQQLGVTARSVVIAVDSRDVPDAQAFVKVLGEEHSILDERGGALRILVQSDTGDPREFSQAFAVRPAEAPDDSKKHHRGGHGTSFGTGGVNVWDRLGGNRNNGRDDPTQ